MGIIDRPGGSPLLARSRAVETDVAYFVTYPCPHCRLELEAEHDGWQGWLRCPSCGTPSLPPEILLGHPATMRRVRGMGDVDEDVLVIGDEAAPEAADLLGEPPSTVVSSLRLAFVTGLVISLFILLVSFIDENQVVTGFASAFALIFFLLLLRLPGRRRRR